MTKQEIIIEGNLKVVAITAISLAKRLGRKENPLKLTVAMPDYTIKAEITINKTKKNESKGETI